VGRGREWSRVRERGRKRVGDREQVGKGARKQGREESQASQQRGERN